MTAGPPLAESDRAPGLLLADQVEIAEDVWIGAQVVVHSHVSLAMGCVVQDFAVLGARLGREARDPRPGRPLAVGAESVVGTRAIVYEGVEIAAGVIVGDEARVREGVRLGEGSVLGQRVTVSPDSVVGARTRIQYQSHIAPPGVVEEDVFIGPNVTTTNDNTADRMAPGEEMRGPTLRRGCRIGAGALLLPGVEIGEEAFVAAGSLVTRDVPPRVVVMGRPANVVREVAEKDLLANRPQT